MIGYDKSLDISHSRILMQVLCVDKINRSTNAHNFHRDYVNPLDTSTPIQLRKSGKNNLNTRKGSLLSMPSIWLNKRERRNYEVPVECNDFCGSPLILSRHNSIAMAEEKELNVNITIF